MKSEQTDPLCFHKRKMKDQVDSQWITYPLYCQMMDQHLMCPTSDQQWVHPLMKAHMKIMDGRFTKDVRKEWRGPGSKGVILRWVVIFKLPLTLFMNDNACWFCNTNSISGLFLVHNKWRVRNGRTQDSIIQRNNWVRRWRLWNKMHMKTWWTHNQIYKLSEVMLGGCERWTSVWAWSST